MIRLRKPDPAAARAKTRGAFDIAIKSAEEGACVLCQGWGYASVDFFPQQVGGRWALRMKSKACPICHGSGLDPKRHSSEEIKQGRAYHQRRLELVLDWLAVRMRLGDLAKSEDRR